MNFFFFFGSSHTLFSILNSKYLFQLLRELDIYLYLLANEKSKLKGEESKVFQKNLFQKICRLIG